MPTGQRAPATHYYVDKEVVSLREYLEVLIHNLETKIDERSESQNKALVTADRVNDMRLASMNEFRAALTDQAQSFITKSEHEALIQSIKQEMDGVCDDIESLKLSRAELAGKASQSQVNVATAISLISLLVGVVSIVFRLLGK